MIIEILTSHGAHRCRASKKVTTHTPTESLAKHLPQEIVEASKESPFYVRSSAAIVITSEKTSHQSKNTEDCIEKRNNLFKELAKKIIQRNLAESRSGVSVKTE